METRILSVILVFYLNCHLNQGRDVNKAQQYNPNIDFLSHESGVGPPDPKGNLANIQNTGWNFQNNQRPTPSGKRDYVAPQRSTPKTNNSPTEQTTKSMFDSNFPPLVSPDKPSSGKRDYVNPNWSSSPQTSARPQTSPSTPLLPQSTNKPQSSTFKPKNDSNGKRDYVNPNWPALPTPPSPNRPSTSSISTPKPPSFSSVVIGGNKPNGAVVPSAVPSIAPPKKPAASVLPSTLVNNNQNNGRDGPSDAELQTLSEELLKKDTNNAFSTITINYQEKTTSQSKEDKAPLPLLVIPESVWNMPTVQKFVPLLDNYEWNTLVNEYITPQERKEENEFMDVIMSTTVIRHLMNFLKDKGYVTLDPKQQRDYLKQLWFTLYSRGKGKIGSSGFEHIFVSELKNDQVSGLHNWIYFAKQESFNRVNYLGYMKLAEFNNNKGAVLKFHFTQQGYDKPVDTLFIGTSPELEMALYTLCFVTRPDKDCRLKLGGKDVNIQTHAFRYRSKNLIGSAFPQI